MGKNNKVKFESIGEKEKALANQRFTRAFVDLLGLEPRTTGPKPAVLPITP